MNVLHDENRRERRDLHAANDADERDELRYNCKNYNVEDVVINQEIIDENVIFI